MSWDEAGLERYRDCEDSGEVVQMYDIASEAVEEIDVKELFGDGCKDQQLRNVFFYPSFEHAFSHFFFADPA